MPGRILILDDNMTRRITIAARLSGAFYDIHVASSEPEAHAIIASEKPGVILIADELECVSATDFIGRLRKDPRHATTTIFVLTAPGAQNGRADLLTAGADEVLPRSEPDDVFRARLRSHERSRDTIATLQVRGEDGPCPGLSEPTARFRPKLRVTLMAPDASQAGRWRDAIGLIEGVQVSVGPCDGGMAGSAPLASYAQSGNDVPVRGQTPPGTGRATASAQAGSDLPGLVMLGVLPGEEHRAFRMLAEQAAPADTEPGELLIFAPEADTATIVAAYEAGAGAVMTGPFDPAEVIARLRLLHDRMTRRSGLRRALQEGLAAAITDPLTSLYNRRHALPHLERLSAQAAERGQDLAVLILDLDHFKEVNDAHGHAVGDIALQSMAQILQANLRPEDLIARIGGEEFLVALPETDIETARNIAARLCRKVRETPVLLAGKRPALHLTVSVGLTMSRGRKLRAKDMLLAADAALYVAKGQGRDQVVVQTCPAKVPPRTGQLPAAPILTGKPQEAQTPPQLQMRLSL